MVCMSTRHGAGQCSDCLIWFSISQSCPLSESNTGPVLLGSCFLFSVMSKM